MPKEKFFLDRKVVEKNPDYFTVESDGEVFEMVLGMLQETVYGQPEACAEVARAMARSFGDFCDANRPQFVGLFLGEPGVGKTEMGRAVAKILDPIHPENRIKMVDCNMFQQSHDVERILGAPPSYVGYGDDPLISGEFLKQQNVIVFDEIEKADVTLHRLLLRIMDKGKLEINGCGERILDFSRSTIILTSNIGSTEIVDIKKGKGSLGFDLDNGEGRQVNIQQIGVEAAQRYWRYMPEFLSRIDSTVVFNSLTTEVCYLLVDKFLEEYSLSQGAMTVLATDQLKNWIVGQVDIRQAGRELRRMIDRLIITPAAEVSLKLPKGTPLIADISQDGSNKVVFWVSKQMVKPRIG